MINKDFKRGMILLLTAQTLVGLNIVISKFIVATIPVSILLLIRFSIASVILLPLHWLTAASSKPLMDHFSKLGQRDWLFIFAQGLCAGFLFNVLMLTGLNYTDANIAGIITSALPAIIAIMSWLILKESISAQKSLCILFASAGLVAIAYDKFHGLGASHSFIGDLIVLLSLFPEATYYVLCKIYPNRLPIFLTSSLLNGLNALLLLPVIFFVNYDASAFTSLAWIVIFVTGLSSGLFYVLWFIGSKDVDGMTASLSTAVMPVSAVIIAWLILGEDLSLMEFFGMGLVIFSIFLYARR